MKVYGGTEFVENVQSRLIVATNSWTRARELLKAVGITGMTASHMRWYWSQSWNKIELSIGTREGVWSAPLDGDSKENFKEIVK